MSYKRAVLSEAPGQKPCIITVLFPADLNDGPILFRAKWNRRDLYYGEIEPFTTEHWLIVWADTGQTEVDHSLTDLFTAPVEVGREVRVWERRTPEGEFRTLIVREVQ